MLRIHVAMSLARPDSTRRCAAFGLAVARAALVLACSASLCGTSLVLAQSPTSAAPKIPPRATFGDAGAMFRAGRFPAAYGHFVRLANEGDREAARVALVMHRHGLALFGSQWDASTEELEQWSALAEAADRAEVAARPHPPGTRVATTTGAVDEAVLALDSFRPERRRKR